jgi:hypothetical protein
LAWFKTELAGVTEVREENEKSLNKLKNEVSELEVTTNKM